MKWIILGLLIVVSFFITAKIVFAEKLYLYRAAGTKNDGKRLYGTPLKFEKFPQLNVGFDLPVRLEGESKFWLTVGATVRPELKTEKRNFYLFIDGISIRLNRKYDIRPAASPSSNFPDQAVVIGQVLVGKQSFVFSSINFIDKGMQVDLPDLPKQLFLDYKLRIRSEDGEEEALEGTIEMERTYYTISLFEKFWD